jgi:hypothetical protein
MIVSVADWSAWQPVGTLAWEWGSKLGIPALAGGGILWLIRSWITGRDKALDQGRGRVEAARPEVIPTGSGFTDVGRGSWTLRNRGPGIARDIRVSFTGSANIVRLREIEPDSDRRTREPRTPEHAIEDSSFFAEAWQTPATLTVRYKDRFANEYVTALAVRQQPRADGRFNMTVDWDNPRVTAPEISKQRLREIGAG